MEGNAYTTLNCGMSLLISVAVEQKCILAETDRWEGCYSRECIVQIDNRRTAKAKLCSG